MDRFTAIPTIKSKYSERQMEKNVNLFVVVVVIANDDVNRIAFHSISHEWYIEN